MRDPIPRRQFLKSAPAAGALAYTAAAHADPVIDSREDVAPLVDVPEAAFALRDYPIRPKRYSEVALASGFWKSRVDTNATVTIPFEFAKREGSARSPSNNVLEAAILSLATHPNAALQAKVEARVRQLRQAQPGLGNAGFEVAATYYLTTGRRDLLDHASASAALLGADFERNDPPFSGGERDAMNCVALYRVTHDPTHLALARHYLDIRGLANSVNRSRHNQSYKPVLEQSEAVGHAVNCVTLMVSMVDVGILAGQRGYYVAAHRMWQDAVTRKMYVTGGVGSTGNEGFGEPYSLPNISAYAETCAVLMFMTLNHRLFLATGDSRYIDVLERGMYNNAIAGVSAAGDHYFYVNRLASAGDGRDLRWQHASLECCPPNLVRFLAAMPGYIYAQDRDDAVYVNLHVSSDATFRMHGRDITLSARSELPWGGKTGIRVSARAPVHGTIRLRIPGWARNQPLPGPLYVYRDRSAEAATISVNGGQVRAVPDRSGYVSLEREWRDGDVIEITFPVQARRVVADARVRENRGRVAIERGPLVYCAEWPDVEGGRALDRLLDDRDALRPRVDPAFAGVTVIDTAARSVTNPAAPARPVTLIPYYLWAHRGAGEMSVWLAREQYAVGDVGPAGGFIFYVNPNYAADGWRYLEAAPFDQSAGAPWGCFRREIPGARGTAIGTGRQNTADMLVACPEPGSAAQLCVSFSLNGVRGWFLPSRDELASMYRNLAAHGLGDFQCNGVRDNFTYWASTQNTADMAAHIDFPDLGRLHGDDKDFPRRVRAIRAF
jgi:hypothetical protein